MELHAELRSLRLEMGYSMADMAALMGIKKPTYQGYETGRREMPAGFINRAREWQQIDMEFMAGIPVRVDQHQTGTILSAGVEDWHEAEL
jgi:transcriptional regulator with XRE-family HTH domain